MFYSIRRLSEFMSKYSGALFVLLLLLFSSPTNAGLVTDVDISGLSLISNSTTLRNAGRDDYERFTSSDCRSGLAFLLLHCSATQGQALEVSLDFSATQASSIVLEVAGISISDRSPLFLYVSATNSSIDDWSAVRIDMTRSSYPGSITSGPNLESIASESELRGARSLYTNAAMWVDPLGIHKLESGDTALFASVFSIPNMPISSSGNYSFEISISPLIDTTSVSSVSEPSAIALLAIGLSGIGFCRRKSLRTAGL